jgi:hypothetical protein
MNLDRLYSDTMALEFIKLNINIRVMITYPNINNKFNEWIKQEIYNDND